MNVIPRAQRAVVAAVFRRNLGVSSILAQKGQASDPIQKLFVTKIKEYDQKSKAAGGKLVESNPQIEKELKGELERITKVFGGGANVDMTKFPAFNFEEPKLDPINQAAVAAK